MTCTGTSLFLIRDLSVVRSGFDGLEVACWPLVPKFAGSNPAEAVGFLRAKKILSTPSFGSKVVCKRVRVEVAVFGRNYRPFLAQVVTPFTTRVCGEDTWRCKYERLKTRVCTISLRLHCIQGH